MRRSIDPATLVVCARLPQPIRRGGGAWLDAAGRAAEVVTWSADIDTLADLAATARGRCPTPLELALSLQPDWLDSRSTLRRMVVAARQACPGLTAAVLRGPRPLAHRSLLAEEGIQTVVVDVFGDAGRGSRRPAPTGWRCRNPVWGLWEVQVDPPRRSGFVGWLLDGSMPRARRGALHVLHAGDVPADRPLSGRLERWISWAARREAAGLVRTARLADLPSLLAHGGQAPISGSVLKAA